SGVGGLSLGAARAGFDVKMAVEIDQHAINTHAINFPRSLHVQEDVSLLNAEIIKGFFKNDMPIDGIIGGPPCQGFSSIGKGNPDDSRNQLYMHFYRLVSELQPLFFLAENVPGIMQEKYSGIRNKAFNLVSGDYDILDPIKVKASDYGAPTIRTRYFFIGVKKSLKLDISDEVFMPKMIDPVTVKDALYGLPDIIDANWQSDSESWRTIKKDRKGGFYEKLWGQIPRNVGDTESIAKLKNNIISGCTGTLHSKIVQERYASLSFGETDKISRSTRLDPNGFCPTLRAGTARDKGSFQAVRPIHPYHPRVITPREAARLQGFPDWFRFHVTKWHSFRQIGNSVSPIVAEYILKGLYNLLNKRVQPEYLNHNSLEVRV
ncbi:DNA cytosine methyltransferase, partial [Escherichia coli]|nr:DNA cytosine methyltransferase [Escherichia coli]